MDGVAMKKRSSSYVWLDNKMMKAEDAKVPILTHSMQYGSGMFEGIRTYETEKGAAIFRLDEHVKRLEGSMKVYSMNLAYSQGQIKEAIIKTVKANGLRSCYIRPFAFYNDANIGVSAFGKKVSLFIAALPFGRYFGGAEKGIRCKVSSWRRINSGILPVEAKASGNYLNSVIANSEARAVGFDEAILLSYDGYVAEGPGENIFLVKDNILLTPDRSSDILLGITRDSVIKIAESMGIEVKERLVHREELCTADELFFAGTAAEITPITNVDGISVGAGKVGPITKMLAQKFDDIVHGRDREFEHWLTYI
jgi:branched-chain amino acid aminotransferase